MIELLKKKGLIGAGGAGFPTYIKYQGLDKIDTILINLAECEPVLESDITLVEKNLDSFVKAIEKLREFTKKKVIVAIKEKHKDLIGKLSERGIEIGKLPNVYPSGDEQLLIYYVLNRRVPAGGLPLDVNVIVSNATTIYNLVLDEPFVSRYVTIYNKGKIWILNVSIGTKLVDIVNYLKISDFSMVIDGGPMMGKVIENWKEFSIGKKTSGILFIKDEKVYQFKKKSIDLILKEAKLYCMNCNTCTLNCSRNSLGHPIRPHLIMKNFAFNKEKFLETNLAKEALYCSLCNVCAYWACPFGLQPSVVNAWIKQQLKQRPEKKEAVDRYVKGVDSYRLERRLGFNIEEKQFVDLLAKFNEYKVKIDEHIGKKANSVVDRNQTVVKNQTIAITDDGLEYHSPINGIIKEVTDKWIIIQKQ